MLPRPGSEYIPYPKGAQVTPKAPHLSWGQPPAAWKSPSQAPSRRVNSEIPHSFHLSGEPFQQNHSSNSISSPLIPLGKSERNKRSQQLPYSFPSAASLNAGISQALTEPSIFIYFSIMIFGRSLLQASSRLFHSSRAHPQRGWQCTSST